MKHALVLVVASAALLAAGARALAGPVEDALAAFKAGEYEKAVAIASKVPAADAAHARAVYLVGEAELARGRWTEAASAFETVLAAKKDNVPALTGLGRARSGAGSHDDAVATLKRAVALDAKDVSARRALGEALLAKGDVADARKDLEAASKLDPKDPLTARALVECQLRANDADAAQRTADAFAKTAPASAAAHFLKGLVLDRRGDVRAAIEAYEKAIATDDRFLDAHRNLAVVLTTSNANYADFSKIEKACEHAQRYVDLGGSDAQLKELLDQIKGFMEEYRKGTK